jgi:phosphotransferase system HPr (HPr) family protein
VSTVRRTCRLVNRDGFHARSVTAIVELARRYGSTLVIAKGEQESDGRSIYLMLLSAAFGDEVEIRADGEDAAELVAALAQLMESGFGEELG